MTSTWSGRIALILAVALVVAVGGSLYFRSRETAWEARAAAALKAAQQQQFRADTLKARADSLSKAAAQSAVVAAKTDTLIQTKIRTIRATPVPVPCQPVVAQRDSIIDELIVSRDHWRDAYRTEVRAFDQQKRAAAVLQARGDSLAAVLKDRPHPRPAWLPRLVFGPEAGVRTDGTTYTGFGVTLGWSVPLP